MAEKYPTMCESFLTGLPLRTLGEMEIPSSIAVQGTIVKAANSYTSYKELWHDALKLNEVRCEGAGSEQEDLKGCAVHGRCLSLGPGRWLD